MHNRGGYLPLVQAMTSGKLVLRLRTDGLYEVADYVTVRSDSGDYVIFETTKPMSTPSTRTPQQASIEAKPAREAWERGEPIEFKHGDTGEWTRYENTQWRAPFFSGTSHFWRVAAAPRVETRWRPWRPGEVPLGAMICRCDNRARRGIITNNDDPQSLFHNHERIYPDGSFMSPCGVEEVVG